jgi:hypothetical protein
MLEPLPVPDPPAVTAGGPEGGGGQPCFEFLPPLLFDTSDNDSAVPSNPRVHAVQLLRWKAHRYALYHIGNDLAYRRIDSPPSFGTEYRSRFNVPPWGDRDYNLFNFAVCDDCRFGFAGFEVQGSVYFDFGTSLVPGWNRTRRDANQGVQGAFTFEHSGQQYLLVDNHPAGCTSGAQSRTTLLTFDDYTAGGQTPVQCVDLGTGRLGILGGEYLPASASPDGFAYAYVVGAGSLVHVFRITGTGASLRLQHVGAPLYGTWLHGRGIRFDLDHDLMVSAWQGGVDLWNVSNPAAPAMVHRWHPPGVTYTNIAAISWPLVFTAAKGTVAVFVYDISQPTNPQLVDPTFWELSNPWNSYNRSSAYDAEFVDGSWLLFARFSVLQQYSVCDPTEPPPDAIFADGFEDGTTSAWSGVAP